MTPETFTGPSVPALLARAQRRLGPDALVLGVHRLARGYQLIACRQADAPLPSPRPDRPLRPVGATGFRPGLGRDGQPFLLAVVGPTGAGKTTTIAKLATHPGVFGGRRVGLLGLDTYRIGAVEQLQSYAEIARLPCEVVYEGDDIPRALKRLRECRVILVDTPGRGPHRQDDSATVRHWLRQLDPAEVHLALPAGQLPAVGRRLLATFRRSGVTHVLATKVDECPEDTTPYDLAVEAGLAMRWQTDGQDVPLHLGAAADRFERARTDRRRWLAAEESVA